jgi:UDP-2,4-diacetamido-2,4,6-trideoxy-beta-L-altropyranose hydrolase
MKPKRRVIFRADGNSRIGLGHVARSLALAHMLREEFECVFAIQAPAKELQEQIKGVCHGLIALPPSHPSEDRFVHELDAYISSEEIVVLDGYDFGTAYQRSVKDKGALLVCIDDIHAFPFVADAVINQAGGVSAAQYHVAPHTKLCLGPAYALLRPPFLATSQRKRTLPQGNPKVLLSLGGADSQNLTLQLAKEIAASHANLQVEVVVGAAYQHIVTLQAWLREQPDFALHSNLSAQQMCELMEQCAAAVTAASGVAYEYAAVGGMLFVLQTADNQEGIYQFLLASGIAREYRDIAEQLTAPLTQEAFEEQVAVQRQHFDGQSPERLCEVFRRLSLGAGLSIREVTEDDLMLLFEWANDEQVRKNSFSTEPIPVQNHKRWFDGVLEDEQTVLYIATADGKPAAHIRFKLVAGKAVISYLISGEFRGRGLGHAILLKGIERLRHQRPELKAVEGLVKPDNVASVRAFEKAGFEVGEPDAGHPKAIRFVLRLN